MIKKSDDFGEWYNEIVELAGLTDKRYPVKGMNVWTPYGWKVMRSIDEYIRHELDATDHQEVCFPLLIPETEFQKEKEHIKGFDAEVYWVTHAGLNPLDIRLCLRPTSETAMYPIFALWVRSHQDLPLKTYQIVNTFRYETKQTRAFIRVREIHFFESHTCHTTDEDAERQVEEDFVILENLMEHLCLPYFLLKRTDWDKFPGAYYTVGVDTPMLEGRSLQLGSIHHYRDNFSRPFEIKYEDVDGTLKYVHQTTFGMSERLVGAVVGFHGDDKGLVLPPDVAPIQVVIIPILAKGKVEEVLTEARNLREELAAAEIRVHIDEKDERPGSKFYNWEIKGVPLRLELGQRDIAEGKVAYAIRFDGTKGAMQRTDLVKDVQGLLNKISSEMMGAAKKRLDSSVADIESLENPPKKILRFGWCGSEVCGHAIEAKTELKLLGTPYGEQGHQSKCIVCGKDTSTLAYAARAM
ncbi:MAG: proline--tRNA ligase [Methanomassiliicoccales archaeon]|nr:proline--tRNA ligase [Methanomassiliicoccales archaeon]